MPARAPVSLQAAAQVLLGTAVLAVQIPAGRDPAVGRPERAARQKWVRAADEPVQGATAEQAAVPC